jgi:hypothetical protein
MPKGPAKPGQDGADDQSVRKVGHDKTFTIRCDESKADIILLDRLNPIWHNTEMNECCLTHQDL